MFKELWAYAIIFKKLFNILSVIELIPKCSAKEKIKQSKIVSLVNSKGVIYRSWEDHLILKKFKTSNSFQNSKLKFLKTYYKSEQLTTNQFPLQNTTKSNEKITKFSNLLVKKLGPEGWSAKGSIILPMP